MLKQKLQYFGHLMQTADSLEESLMLGKIEGRRSRGSQRRWLEGITDEMDMNLGKLRETVRQGRSGMLQSMGFQRVRHSWATEQQQQRHKVDLCHEAVLAETRTGSWIHCRVLFKIMSHELHVLYS